MLYVYSGKNAAARGIAFDLSKDEFEAMWCAAGGKCTLTGIRMGHPDDKLSKWQRNPWGASLDRIENDLGYTAANCRLVCVCVNLALNEWGEEVLRKMAMGLLGFGPIEHPTAKSGSGLPRGITMVRITGSRPAYRVRVHVNGKLKDCGSRFTLPDAIQLLDRVKQVPQPAKWRPGIMAE